VGPTGPKVVPYGSPSSTHSLAVLGQREIVSWHGILFFLSHPLDFYGIVAGPCSVCSSQRGFSIKAPWTGISPFRPTPARHRHRTCSLLISPPQPSGHFFNVPPCFRHSAKSTLPGSGRMLVNCVVVVDQPYSPSLPLGRSYHLFPSWFLLTARPPAASPRLSPHVMPLPPLRGSRCPSAIIQRLPGFFLPPFGEKYTSDLREELGCTPSRAPTSPGKMSVFNHAPLDCSSRHADNYPHQNVLSSGTCLAYLNFQSPLGVSPISAKVLVDSMTPPPFGGPPLMDSC